MMVVCFTQDGGHAGNQIMARLFREGWETLAPLRYFECGHYRTTLYLPDSAPMAAVQSPL